MTITNNTAAVSSGSLTFDCAGGQELSQGRNAEWSRSGTTVTAADQSCNGVLATGASVSAGFLGSWSGSNPSPSSFKLNGTTCNVDADPSPAPTPTPPPTGPPDTGDGTPPALMASGNKLVDADGTTRRPLGVNRSGGEFRCARGHGQYTGNPAGCSDAHAGATTTQAYQCRRDGGTCPGIGYEVAGMRDLVDAVRATGAGNLILADGIAHSNDPSQWLTYKPDDPKHNLAAAWHVHNFNTCANEGCWNSPLAPVAVHVPPVAGEIGENTCTHSFIDQVMKWFDHRGRSYLGWTWNTWRCTSGPALISGYDGTPTAYDIGPRDHPRSLDG